MSLASRLTVDGCRFTTRYSTQSFVIPCSRPSVIVGPRPYDEARRRSLSPYQTLAAACPEFPTVLDSRLARFHPLSCAGLRCRCPASLRELLEPFPARLRLPGRSE